MICFPKCINTISVDTIKEEDVKRVFDYIKEHEKGKLDILINNNYANNHPNTNLLQSKPLWEKSPLEGWNDQNTFQDLRTYSSCLTLASRYI